MKNHSESFMSGMAGKYDDDYRISRRGKKGFHYAQGMEETTDFDDRGSLHRNRGYREGHGFRSRCLVRILRSRVGDNWNDVYSDLCKSHTSDPERRFLDDILSYKIWSSNKWWGNFYVDSNGILRECNNRHYRFRRDTTPSKLIDGKYVLVDGVWYEFTFLETNLGIGVTLIDCNLKYYNLCADLIRAGVIHNCVGGDMKMYHLKSVAGKWCVPSSKRALGKREIRRNNLWERINNVGC